MPPSFSGSRAAVKRDVSARWTKPLADAGWTPIADTFLDGYVSLEPPISNAEFLLIVHLMRYKWDASAPFPGFKTLARKMNLTPTSVRNHARSLEKKGYLKRRKRVGATNRFDLTLLFEALEKLLKKKLATASSSEAEDEPFDSFASESTNSVAQEALNEV